MPSIVERWPLGVILICAHLALVTPAFADCESGCRAPLGPNVPLTVYVGEKAGSGQWAVWVSAEGACYVYGIAPAGGLTENIVLHGSDRNDVMLTPDVTFTACGINLRPLRRNGFDVVLEGRGGNDLLVGYSVAKRLRGGAGDDALISTHPSVKIEGGPGNDDIESWGNGTSEVLYGGDAGFGRLWPPVESTPSNDCFFDANGTIATHDGQRYLWIDPETQLRFSIKASGLLCHGGRDRVWPEALLLYGRNALDRLQNLDGGSDCRLLEVGCCPWANFVGRCAQPPDAARPPGPSQR